MPAAATRGRQRQRKRRVAAAVARHKGAGLGWGGGRRGGGLSAAKARLAPAPSASPPQNKPAQEGGRWPARPPQGSAARSGLPACLVVGLVPVVWRRKLGHVLLLGSCQRQAGRQAGRQTSAFGSGAGGRLASEQLVAGDAICFWTEKRDSERPSDPRGVPPPPPPTGLRARPPGLGGPCLAAGPVGGAGRLQSQIIRPRPPAGAKPALPARAQEQPRLPPPRLETKARRPRGPGPCRAGPLNVTRIPHALRRKAAAASPRAFAATVSAKHGSPAPIAQPPPPPGHVSDSKRLRPGPSSGEGRLLIPRLETNTATVDRLYPTRRGDKE
ncbi:collagen alpha-1(I) chain-like [Sphaerodactylus townsendi]|uniref:collagen alpha-1(I) chain-like n=1 Tax=Sphaerodactylus townsendi TaxID=933632 RepID=UPI002025CDED|nr:collagen alpha-1(I) chain-like [Sphaerodactylus townsendi]